MTKSLPDSLPQRERARVGADCAPNQAHEHAKFPHPNPPPLGEGVIMKPQ